MAQPLAADAVTGLIMKSRVTLFKILTVLALLAVYGGSRPARAQVPTQIQLVGYATSSLSASAATTYSVTVPGPVLVGDFLLFVGSNSPGSGGGGPSGWTFLASATPSNTAIGFSLWYRIATSADAAGATYTWTVTNSSRVGGAISAFRGVDNTNPILDYGTAVTSSNSLSRTAPSVTPGVANNAIVAIYSAANGNADTPAAPTGMTQIFAAGDADGVNGVFLSAFLETFAPATASGNWVSTSSSISAESVGGTVALRPATVSPSAYWHFDEITWNGTAGEVVDSGGSGYNGVAAHGATPTGTSPALSGSPGTCNYATFNGSTQYVEMPGALPHVGNEFTVTAWIRPTANQIGRIWLDDENNNGFGISFGDSGSAKLRIYSRQPSTVSVDSNITLTLNTWYFVALVSDVTVAGGMYLIILDSSGNLLDKPSLSRSSFSAGTGSHATVGGTDDGETGTQYRFAGNIDEVTIFQYDLPIPSLQMWALTTHPCTTTIPDHYKVINPATAVNCAPAAVTIAAHTSAHAILATPDTITLGTSTGHGDWTLTTGGGTFTAGGSNSGAATYQYVVADNGSAVFALRDTYAETVTINVTDGSVTATSGTATAAEDSALTFAPSGFITTNGSNVATAIGTQIAGKTSTLTTALQAVSTNTQTGACTTVFASGTTKTIGLAYQCNNPTACVSGQTLTITNNGTTTAIASNPNSGIATYTPVSLTFGTANGEALINLTYSDAGQITLASKYTIPLGNTANSTNIMVGASQFVVQPNTLVVSSIKGTASPYTANPALTTATASGAVFLAAGQAFSATVTALNYLGNATPNFGQETTPATVTLVPTLVLPTSGHDPSVGGTFNAFAGGIASGTGFSWPEVGFMTLTPTVTSYLTSGTLTGTTTANVGRFIPNAFATQVTTPAVFGTPCSGGLFGYVGQPFVYLVAPVLTVTPQALGGATTQNYTGSLMRMTNNTLTGRTYTPTPSSPALVLTGLPASTADPAIADLGTGLVSLTFGAGSGISFARGSASAPFSANLALTINVSDLDAVSATNPVTVGSTMAFSTSAQQYYGRLYLRNALGSELLDLPVPLVTQYYLSTSQGFVTNTSDVCTSAPALTFSNYQLYLNSGETCVRDSGKPGVSGQGCTTAASSPYASTAVAGAFNLILSAPGAGNSGAVSVTATAPTWLQYLWGSTSNPVGLATFGVFPGSPTRVYQRELY